MLARRYEWDMDAVWQSLLSWLDAQPRSVRSRPELSAALQSLLKQAWLAATLAGDEQIRSVHLLTAMVETSGLTHCEGIWPLMTLTASQLEKLRPLLEVQSDERHDIASSSTVSNVTVIGRAAPLQGEMPKTENPGAVQGDTVLNRFTVNVTARASEGKIDPVFGRDNEIRQMVDILSRRRKNNPILVGEPGVGKTALVEGLALRIAEGNVPESLRPVIVRTLDLGLLQAGAGVKGEFEQRLKNIIDAVQHSPVDTLPEQLTRLQAELTSLAMEQQELLEDIALGNAVDASRLPKIEQFTLELNQQKVALQSQYEKEKLLTDSLKACRADISRQEELSAFQQELLWVQNNSPLLGLDVDVRTIATVIADWTGVPLSSLMKDEQTELLTLEKQLATRVVGQSPALNAIAQRLRASKTGLTPENGPQGVFLLVGPSGVGKTETALALADVMYGGEKSLITINLSEYQEPHTVSQLKGSPPGYVGYGQGGILTEAVRKRPYSVVLLDEVEKAHRDVMNLFYQVYDRGFMRDGEGREIDFRNTVILMTSNLGSDPLMQLLEEQPEATESDLHELLRPILRDHFQPALLARFQTVIYRPLAMDAMRTIVGMKLAQVSTRLQRHYGISTHTGESLIDTLTKACLLPDTGARNVDSLLNQQILPVLSQQLLSHMAAKQKPSSLQLTWDDEEGIVLAFDAQAEGEPS